MIFLVFWIFSVTGLLLPNQISLSWKISSSQIFFTLKHPKLLSGYIGIGLKPITGKNSMEDSDLWIFDISNSLITDHKGEGNGFPDFDYENNIKQAHFNQTSKIIHFQRDFKTGDPDDIIIGIGKYKLLWCIGKISKTKILEHGYGNGHRGILEIEFTNKGHLSYLFTLLTLSSFFI